MLLLNVPRCAFFRSPRVVLSPKQRNMKRKSPRMVLSPRAVIFRSPLSRMVLSPRPVIFRSPLSIQRASPVDNDQHVHEVDLNASPVDNDQHVYEVDLNASLVDNDQQVHEVDLNADAVDHPVDNDEENEVAPPNEDNARRKELPDDTRKAIVEFLLAKSKNDDLTRRETREAATKFSVHIRTVQRIWTDAKCCLDQGRKVDVSSKKWKRGRKKKEVDVSKLSELPISSRTTLEDVSKELGVSKAKLHKMKREGTIERVSNSLKPFLTEINKKERLKWCVSMLDPRSVPHDPIFKGLFDFVVIDEKWFNITRRTERYYKTPGEEQPARTCKNKNFIPKIMFLCALARPRFDSHGNCTFDGKIGCFPFVTFEAAKRSSKNRRAGAIEMKPMESIKMDVCREFLIEKVLPAIRAKWPQENSNKPIYIQQDNAPSHVAPNDKLFCQVAKEGGFDIRLILQPPNSPDLNILDLGFFSSIQSIQYKTSAKKKN